MLKKKKHDTPQAEAAVGEIDYVNTPLRNLYRQLTPSAIGSMLTATIASMIDVVILSHYLGDNMLAVVNLCMPLYMLINTIGMLISSGAATLYAQSLGEDKQEEANRFFSVAFYHIIICGIVLTAGGLLFTGQIVDLLGANEALRQHTTDYVQVLFLFIVPLIVYVFLLFFVRIDNDPNRALIATVVCAATNFILDILFVGWLQWGVRGAALATCLAYVLGMLVNLTHFLSRKNSLRLVRKALSGRSVRVWRVGMPLAASQLGMMISTQLINNILIRVGNENYVKVYAVIIQLSMTAMAIYDGVGQAAQPIIAAAVGAKQKERIQRAFRYALRLVIAGTLILTALYIVFVVPILWLFSIKGGDLLNLSRYGIRIYALSVPLMGVNTLIMYYFQAQEKTALAIAVSLISGSVLLVLTLMGLIAVFGENGIWFSWVIAQVLSMGIILAMYKGANRERSLLNAE